MANKRVLRVVEIEGPEEWVDQQVSRSINGEVSLGGGRFLRVATVGTFYPPPSEVNNPISGRGEVYGGDDVGHIETKPDVVEE